MISRSKDVASCQGRRRTSRISVRTRNQIVQKATQSLTKTQLDITKYSSQSIGLYLVTYGWDIICDDVFVSRNSIIYRGELFQLHSRLFQLFRGTPINKFKVHRPTQNLSKTPAGAQRRQWLRLEVRVSNVSPGGWGRWESSHRYILYKF
jgi:hypothetical protein